MIKFKLHSDWEKFTGHCQITYVSKNSQGQKIVHCLQDNGEKYGGIRLMRCSQDGEPAYEVKIPGPVIFEKPKGDSKLELLTRIWIEKREKQNE